MKKIISSIIIDGKLVDQKRLDIKKHRYIGTFRFPYTECGKLFHDSDEYKYPNIRWDHYCPLCGGLDRSHLCNPFTPREHYTDHYLAGHYDMPQYISIKNK